MSRESVKLDRACLRTSMRTQTETRIARCAQRCLYVLYRYKHTSNMDDMTARSRGALRLFRYRDNTHIRFRCNKLNECVPHESKRDVTHT